MFSVSKNLFAFRHLVICGISCYSYRWLELVSPEVPPGSTVVGVPGRVVRRDNMSLPQEELDQTHLPDPVREDISGLQRANAELTNRLLDLEREMKSLRKERIQEK